MLLASIRDPNPVIFFEPKWLYRSAVEEVPVEDYTIPLGKARIVRAGKDITVVGMLAGYLTLFFQTDIQCKGMEHNYTY